jgi:hypothetical protein
MEWSPERSAAKLRVASIHDIEPRQGGRKHAMGNSKWRA